MNRMAVLILLLYVNASSAHKLKLTNRVSANFHKFGPNLQVFNFFLRMNHFCVKKLNISRISQYSVIFFFISLWESVSK